MATKSRAGLDGEIDALFRLPLSDFTPARNALAARLRKEKRAIEAERVRSLAKPPAPAWAVNQLYWEDPQAIEQLLAVAERIRKAQTGRSKNADVRQLLAEKKQMTAALMERASAILREAGHAASPDAMRRVSATLESLAMWGNTEDAPAAGRLTADLDPPGFDALAAVMGGTKLAPSKVLAFRAPKVSAEAVQKAEKALREARRDAAAAEAAWTKAKNRAAEMEARYAEAREEERKASVEAKKTAEAAARAERLLDEAKAGS